MLADHLVDPVKPPLGELEWSAEEPDSAHHIQVHEQDPIIGLKHSNSPFGLPCFSLILPSNTFVISHLFSLHFKSKLLVRCLIHSGDVQERLWEGRF